MLDIQNQVANNREQAKLLKAVDQINESFFLQLTEKFPTLTGRELRLAALLRLNLSSKEIATILGIAPKSVDMKRYWLRKKMHVSGKVGLAEFLKAEFKS